MSTKVDLARLARITKRLTLVALPILAAALLVAPNPAAAGNPPAATTSHAGPAGVEPHHLITCDQYAGNPFWVSGDTMAGWAYWSCSASPDINLLCAQTQAYDKIDKSWFANNTAEYCSSSTSPTGKVEATGPCIGWTGHWAQQYRIYYHYAVFHGNWIEGSGYGPVVTLYC